jgi:hypothetical protein
MKINSILLLVVILNVPELKAQESIDLQPHFSEVWAGLIINKELSKKFNLELKDQIRISESLHGLRLNLLEVGLGYQIYKKLNVSAKYRFSFRSNARNTKRISVDLAYKTKIKPVKIEVKYRARFQNSRVTYTGESVNFIRNKLTISKKISKKWSGYSSYEIFHNLNDEFEHQSNRFVLGAKYKVNKHFGVKAFAQYDQDIHGKYQPTRSVFGMTGTYSFK